MHVRISRSSAGHLSPDGSSRSSEEQTLLRGTQWFPPAFSRSFSADEYDYMGGSGSGSAGGDGKRLKEFVRSVYIGWKHSLVLTSSHKVFGWGDIHFSVLSEVGFGVDCSTRFGLKESQLNIDDDLDADIVADVFSKPTQLFVCDSLMNASNRKNSPQSFLDLYGCSNSTLTLLGIDVERVNIAAVNKAANKSTRLSEEKSSPPTLSQSTLEAKEKEKEEAAQATSKVSKVSVSKPTFLSPEGKNKSKNLKNVPAAARTAQQKKEIFSPLFTKENSTKSISFNVDPSELKERFRAELKRREREKKRSTSAPLSTTSSPTPAVPAATPPQSNSHPSEEQPNELLVSPSSESKSNSSTSNISTIQHNSTTTVSKLMMMMTMMSEEKSTLSPLRIDLDSPVMRRPSPSPKDSPQTKDSNTAVNLSDNSLKVVLFEPLHHESKEKPSLIQPASSNLTTQPVRPVRSSQPPAAVRKSLPLPADSMLQLFSAQQLGRMRQQRQQKQQQTELAIETGESLPELKVYISHVCIPVLGTL